MRRQAIALGLLIFLLVLLLVPVSADMIAGPYNSYFSAHPSKLTKVDLYYEVPPGMTVNVYQSPEEGGLIQTLEEGHVLPIPYSCTIEDTIWGFNRQLGGWVRLGRLQRIYSHTEFLADHESHLIHDPSITINRADFTEPILSWTYPGSGQQDNPLMPSETSDIVQFQSLYTDETGGQWAYVGFHYGSVGWIYLDAPCNPDPPFHLEVSIENTVTDTAPTESDPVPPKDFFSTYLWPVVLVCTVVLITGLAVYALKLPSKNKY